MTSPKKHITIIFEDEDLIIANKPSGLLCVPGLSDPNNLFDQVKAYNPNARTVHRLDMGTSGLVIFAKHYEAQKAMSKLFELRKVDKQYCAKVSGILDSNYGEIHSSMLCDWPNRPKQMIQWLDGKPASTFFKVEEFYEDSTLVALKPHTGRTHQLRLHMLQIGHPILGDELYNIDGSNKRSERLLLHAEQLQFNHPISGEPMNIIERAEFR